jgi:hypothetical protein
MAERNPGTRGRGSAWAVEMRCAPAVGDPGLDTAALVGNARLQNEDGVGHKILQEVWPCRRNSFIGQMCVYQAAGVASLVGCCCMDE